MKFLIWYVCLLAIGFRLSYGATDVNGGWGPWQADPEIDCCMYGGYERVQRYCNNPSPEGSGTLCMDSASQPVPTGVETKWRTCSCVCYPPCDGVTAFCANDTGAAAYCACNYGMIVDPVADPNNITRCITPPAGYGSTTEEPKVYPTLTTDTKDILSIVEIVTIIWLLLCLVAVLVLFLILLNFKPDRIIQMQEEITLLLVYILILVASERTSSPEFCRAASVLLHYLFMCTMSFFCLEALHAYSMVTYIVPKKGFFHILINLAIGYGGPIIPMAFSLGFIYNDYGTSGRHCWCNFDSGQGWAFVFPVAFLGFVCTVIAEAQGQGKYKSLPDVDKSEFVTARVSQGSIMIIMPLSIASYMFGMLAVDLQSIALYSLFSIVNVVLGPLIFFFHTIGNEQVRAILAKIFFCCPCFKKQPDVEGPDDSPPPPAPSNKIAPFNEPVARSHPEAGTGHREPKPGDPDYVDSDWQNLYKWVSDGKNDNIDKAENVLFEKVPTSK